MFSTSHILLLALRRSLKRLVCRICNILRAMRLLECSSSGGFRLREFNDHIPQYAILSHTWGTDTEEVTFRDLMEDTGKTKTGYNKIRFCGEQAERDGIQYFWVDSCCIDKSSSAELTEAINSMFRWYQNAAKCYVYLSDVSTNGEGRTHIHTWQMALAKSRWFTRGWTLQELLAPRSVEFFCSNRTLLGDKRSLAHQLHDITGIAISALQETAISTFSVFERLSWISNRQTKREEDIAYCLLGIFDTSMEIIYGEGKERAFERLNDKLYSRSKKRERDALSTVTEASLKNSKRPKTSDNHLSDAGPEIDRYVNDPKTACTSMSSTLTTNLEIKKSLIERLYFDEIDQRLTSLSSAHGKTCRWFLFKPEYLGASLDQRQPRHREVDSCEAPF